MNRRPPRTRSGPRLGGRQGSGSAAGHPGRKSGADRGLGGDQVEGRQAVRELLLAGKRRVRELYLAADADGVDDLRQLAAAARIPITEVSRNRLDALARSEAPQGVVARAQPLSEVGLDDLLRRRGGRPPFVVALDGVTDPGNLGAILRSADGAGVTGVILPRHRAAHIGPTAAKSAAGAIEHIPIALVPGLASALATCRQKGVWVVGFDDDAERSLFDLGDLASEALVLVLGAEGAGLSRLVRERCDLVVSIPMFGKLSSLNVSNAAALAMYEVVRTRNARTNP